MLELHDRNGTGSWLCEVKSEAVPTKQPSKASFFAFPRTSPGLGSPLVFARNGGLGSEKYDLPFWDPQQVAGYLQAFTAFGKQCAVYSQVVHSADAAFLSVLQCLLQQGVRGKGIMAKGPRQQDVRHLQAFAASGKQCACILQVVRSADAAFHCVLPGVLQQGEC